MWDTANLLASSAALIAVVGLVAARLLTAKF